MNSVNLALLVTISIVLSVLAIGLKASFPDAIYLFQRPLDLLRVVVSMNAVMPLFAVLLALTFDLNNPLKIALGLLSVSPVPPILPNKSMKAGGLENYTMGLLVATALLSTVLIPLAMVFFEVVAGVPLSMRARDVFVVVLKTLLAPLLIGILIRAGWPAVADRVARPLALLGLILLVVCCIPLLMTATRAVLTLAGDGTLVILAAFSTLGVIVGHLLGGPERDNRPVLALATSTRHPAVALSIAHANFPNQKLTTALILIYALLTALIALPYLHWYKKTQTAATQQENPAEI